MHSYSRSGSGTILPAVIAVAGGLITAAVAWPLASARFPGPLAGQGDPGLPLQPDDCGQHQA
jgi:hypothetical protein